MSDVDSAIPAQLLDYSSWAQGQNGALQQAANQLNQAIEDFNTSGRSSGIVGAVPYAGNDGVAYATRNAATDQWVGQVGEAFLDAARAQLPPGVARMPDVTEALAQGPVTTTDARLAAIVGGDPVELAAKQAAAAKLAAQLDEAIVQDMSSGRNGAEIQSLLQELAQHQGDPVYNSAFFKQLGPGDTLVIAWELGTPNTPGGNNNLRIFDQALASATQSEDWDPSFNQALFAPVYGRPPVAAFSLLKYGAYSEDFLFTAGDAELNLGADQRANSPEIVTTTLDAIARNPQAALDYLTTPPAGWPAGAPTRLVRILEVYGQDLRAGAGAPVVGAMKDLLWAAGASPQAGAPAFSPTGTVEPEIQILLQTLGEVPQSMVPSTLGPAIAGVISNHVDLFVPQDPTQTVNAGWTWQEHVFQLAESDGTGRINMAAVSEIERAIGQWQLNHAPQGFSFQTPNIESWTKYLGQVGVLWGLAALPVRQAPYDLTAMKNAQVTALSDVIGLIPFSNFVPAKHALVQFIVGEGAVLLNEVGTSALTSAGVSDDQQADDTFYRQAGAMSMVLATQFLSAHPDLVPKDGDFNQWVVDIAGGKAPLGSQTPPQVTQFITDLDAALRTFSTQYNNPGR